MIKFESRYYNSSKIYSDLGSQANFNKMYLPLLCLPQLYHICHSYGGPIRAGNHLSKRKNSSLPCGYKESPFGFQGTVFQFC